MRTQLASAFALALGLIGASGAYAQDTDEMIASAMSAGPPSLAENATITDRAGNVLREGSNGWTCMPDNPDADGTDPWCYNAPWGGFLAAYAGGEPYEAMEMGIAYMLAGDAPTSNTDPFATGPSDDNDWIPFMGGHLMIVLPGEDPYAGYSQDPYNGGPFVMWAGTDYAHLMVPIDDAHIEHQMMPMDGDHMDHSDHMGDME